MIRNHKKRDEARAGVKAPIRILALQRELDGRFVSVGGRPADQAATIRRLVTIRHEVWSGLQRQAILLSRLGLHVSPGQLAAVLLEKAVSQLEAGASSK